MDLLHTMVKDVDCGDVVVVRHVAVQDDWRYSPGYWTTMVIPGLHASKLAGSRLGIATLLRLESLKDVRSEPGSGIDLEPTVLDETESPFVIWIKGAAEFASFLTLAAVGLATSLGDFFRLASVGSAGM